MEKGEVNKMEIDFQDKDIISITDFTKEEILYLCQQAQRMYDLEKNGKRYDSSHQLTNRALASMFYEPSTRTRTSFNTAIRELGGQRDGFVGTEGTSVTKKETIRDTIKMMEANHFDVIAMRHPLDGSLQWAADVADIPVINGGDGTNEHPTQALLDIFTLYMYNDGRLNGLNMGLGGDLAYGRTIRSLSLALSHFDDITIRWSADDFLAMPTDLTSLLESRGINVIREQTVKDVMRQSEFYYMTRPQLERMEGVTQEDVIRFMGDARIDLSKVDGLDVKVMHPLPVNSEIAEIDYRVFFSSVQGFFPQAENGVLMRKALLYEMLKYEGYTTFSGSLSSALEHGNNRLQRTGKERVNGVLYIDKISDGVVIDHLVEGVGKQIADELGLEKRRYDSVIASLSEHQKTFLKTNLPELTNRELKRIALMSPEATINIIREGEVSEKFVYLLCQNDNCVTRVVNEDIPLKFYDDGTMRCRYCRQPYEIQTPKVSEQELATFRGSLPKSIEPIHQH
ncbi:aspartate carbamoyltransferase [Candidatus Woesearchaeota archaeon B3_Woes]|nr:MAG: aspartate carbamoyltransferase [Candidatus Woesearchaeota archaeon B3_Woes]